MTMLRTLRAANPSPMTLDGTRTYLVGERRPAVIDPGPALAGHVEAIVAALGGATPVILLTHAHPDHAAAAPELARRTGGEVLAFPRIPDGVPVETDAGPLHVLETPGHTPDHLSFRWSGAAGGDALFVGDAFMGGLDTVMVAPPEGDLAAYLRTLDLVEALAPAVLYPTHGDPIADGAAAARRYRAHRMERIGQVADALAAGAADPEALVDVVYGAELHPELRWAAAGSVQAVVAYLEQVGRARIRPDGLVEPIVGT